VAIQGLEPFQVGAPSWCWLSFLSQRPSSKAAWEGLLTKRGWVPRDKVEPPVSKATPKKPAWHGVTPAHVQEAPDGRMVSELQSLVSPLALQLT
jgi:hypothetical protein